MTRPVVDPRMVGRLTAFFPSVADVQEPTATANALGEPIASWATSTGLGAVPCKVDPLAGEEQRKPDMTIVPSTHAIYLQGYKPTVSELMRVVVSGHTYQVQLVEHDSQHAVTKLLVQWIR